MSKILRRIDDDGFAFWCPGCHEAHTVRVGTGPGPRWIFNGDVDKPTFSPSIKVTAEDPDGELPTEICHSYVEAGRIRFLSDCTHAFVGQTVALPTWAVDR